MFSCTNDLKEYETFETFENEYLIEAENEYANLEFSLFVKTNLYYLTGSHHKSSMK